MMQKFGTLSPVVYFVNHTDPTKPSGHITLAPYSDFPCPRGHSTEYADTLQLVDRLQKRLQEQELREREQEWRSDENLYRSITDSVRDRLYQRMCSAKTSEYEKEFIRLYLQVREDRREKHRQRFMERTMYLWARENDVPKGRRDDEESVNLDRIG